MKRKQSSHGPLLSCAWGALLLLRLFYFFIYFFIFWVFDSYKTIKQITNPITPEVVRVWLEVTWQIDVLRVSERKWSGKWLWKPFDMIRDVDRVWRWWWGTDVGRGRGRGQSRNLCRYVIRVQWWTEHEMLGLIDPGTRVRVRLQGQRMNQWEGG